MDYSYRTGSRLTRTPRLVRLSHLAMHRSKHTSPIDYPFAKYNVQSTYYVYSQEDYNQYLEGNSPPALCPLHPISYTFSDPEWTKEETDYLFNLMREYDGRFFVVHDRYEYPNGPERSIEARTTNVTNASLCNPVTGPERPLLQRLSQTRAEPSVARG